MTATLPVFKPPELPSKWEIIPIHSSDRGSFKRCRRYWDWNSPARHNLVTRADIHGVNPALWFGTGIHYALEKFYNPGIRHDPVETWKTWFDIQWRGGVVTEEWLPLIHDLNPQPAPDRTITTDWIDVRQGFPGDEDIMLWRVKGLEDILPDPNHEVFDELFALGIGMMTFYKDYAEANDGDYQVLMTEHNFSVPIWDPYKNQIMKRIDTRTDSPNYGNTLEVHARGRQDLIYQRVSNGRLGIWDHKSADKLGDDYFDKLETDEQCTNYLWAAQIEAAYYDLPWKGEPFEEVLYQALRKRIPAPPTQLSTGMFSINRTEESCTYEMLIDWISKNIPGVDLTEKQKQYVEFLRTEGDERFVVRKPVRRSQKYLQSAGNRLYLEAVDMLNVADSIDHPAIIPLNYPNLTNDWLCKNCTFRMPCLLKEDQGDWETYLKDNYVSNKDR